MEKIYGYYEYDDSLRPGRSEGGGLSQLLFDSEGKLSDHASFHPGERDDDDDSRYDATAPTSDADPDAEPQAAALLILAVLGAAAGGYVLIRKAAPHVQRMINEHALPAVRSFWNKVRGEGIEDAQSATDEAKLVVVQTPVEERPEESEPGTDVTVPKPWMSAEEWYARFRAMFEAREFADEQWKLLSSVRVADDGAIGELQRAMARNRPEAVVQNVTLMLKSTPHTEEPPKAKLAPIEAKRDSGKRP